MENSFGLSRMKFSHHTEFQAEKRVLSTMLKDFRHRFAACLNEINRFRFCLNKSMVTGFPAQIRRIFAKKPAPEERFV